jgi:tetratricopeptide (TPR) repeat protein
MGPLLYVSLAVLVLLVLALAVWLAAHFSAEARIERLVRRGEFNRALRLAEQHFRARSWISEADLQDPARLTRRGRGPRLMLKVWADRLIRLAKLRLYTGDIDGAERLLSGAREAVRLVVGENSRYHAQFLSSVAGLYLERMDCARAQPLLEQALAIQRALVGERPAPTYWLAPWSVLDMVAMGNTLKNLGGLYLQVGDYSRAVRALEESRTVLAYRFVRTHARRSETLGEVLTNLGSAYLERNDLDRAGEALKQARDHWQGTQHRRHPGTTAALIHLAGWHEKRRELDAAARLLREAVEARRETRRGKGPGYPLALTNLASVLAQMGDTEAGQPLLDEVLALGRRTWGEAHPHFTEAMVLRAGYDVIAGRPAEALARFVAAAALENRLIGPIFSFASSGQRLAYLAVVRKKMFQFLSLVHAHLRGSEEAGAAALEHVLARKGLDAEAATAQRDAVLGGRAPELAGKLRQLLALCQQIAARALAGAGPEGTDAHRRILAQWQDEQDRLETELARGAPEVQLNRQLQQANRSVIAARLPACAALIEVVRYELFDFLAVPARGEERWGPARYAAFVLRPERPNACPMIDLGEAREIDRQIEAFRADLLGGANDQVRGMLLLDEPATVAEEGPGATLRKLVLGPLRSALEGADHLIVAPDGELARLPFEVLPDADGNPLIEAYRFSYVAVGRDVLRMGNKARRRAGPVVIAAPDFDLGTMAPSPSRAGPVAPVRLSRDLDRGTLRFAPLPGSDKEGREVAALLGVGPTLGPEALEGRLKACESPHVLHIATHGFFLPDRRGSAAAPTWVGSARPTWRARCYGQGWRWLAPTPGWAAAPRPPRQRTDC